MSHLEPDPLQRFYLARRVRYQDGRAVRVVEAVLSGEVLMRADANLRQNTNNREAWLCLRELLPGEEGLPNPPHHLDVPRREPCQARRRPLITATPVKEQP